MNKADRLKLNKQLLPVGERICKMCERRLPLDSFVPSIKGQTQRTYWSSECKPCRYARIQARYEDDPEFRRKKNKNRPEYRRELYHRNLEASRLKGRLKNKRWRLNKALKELSGKSGTA